MQILIEGNKKINKKHTHLRLRYGIHPLVLNQLVLDYFICA